MINKFIENIIFHPFLIALFPVFYILNRNADRLSIEASMATTIALICATAILLIFLNIIFKNLHRASILISIFWLWFFSYGSIRSTLLYWTDSALVRHRYLIVIWLFLIIIVFVLSYLIKIDFKRGTKYFNFFSLALTVMLFVPFITYRYSNPIKAQRPANNLNHVLTHVTKGALPDIYYIILDAYAGNNELKQLLDFDNTDFTTYLSQKGFYVCKNSRSNYSWTRPSISSSLNMDYLPLRENGSVNKQYFLADSVNYNSMININKVVPYIRSKGYKYVDLSIWEGLFISSDYQINYKTYKYDFAFALLNMSILGKPLVENYFAVETKRKDILQKIEKLATIPAYSETTFVYAHLMLPHEPFVFDENGDEYSISEKMFQADPKKLYIKQLQYANKLMRQTIDKILDGSKTPPIIIIQGDHGARDLLKDFHQSVRLRTGILNAYYFPDKDYKLLYDTITPVNSFRVVLKKFFSEDIELLADKTYYQIRDSKNSPFTFVK